MASTCSVTYRYIPLLHYSCKGGRDEGVNYMKVRVEVLGEPPNERFLPIFRIFNYERPDSDCYKEFSPTLCVQEHGIY